MNIITPPSSLQHIPLWQPKNETTYEASVRLLTGAYGKDPDQYKDALASIFWTLSINPNASVEEIVKALEGNRSFNAWMVGRILVASQVAGDEAMSQKALSVLIELTKVQGSDLAADCWALGYLSIYEAKINSGTFGATEEKLLSLTHQLAANPSEKGKDNVHWVIVMNLQSLAIKGDKKAFEEQLELLKSFSGSSTVLEALQQIPSTDMPLWALTLTLSAAKRMGESSLVQELEAGIKTFGQPMDNDRMLTDTIPQF